MKGYASKKLYLIIRSIKYLPSKTYIGIGMY